MNQIKAGAILNYVIIGLNTLTGLLYTPFMLRCLGQNEYGLYSLVASVIAYLTLLDFGFGSSVVRYSARIRATNTESRQKEWELYGMFMICYIVMGLLCAVAGSTLVFNVDRIFDSTMTASELSQARIMMILMVANLAFTFPLMVFGSIITAYERFVFVRTTTIARILLSTAVLVGVLLFGYKAIALVVVQTVFSFGTMLLNVFYCFAKLHIRISMKNFDIPLLKEVLVFNWWNFLGGIVDRIYWGTGQFILGAISGTVAVAVFSVSITLMHMYMSISTSLSGVLLPRISSMVVKEGSDKSVSDLFIKTGRLQYFIVFLILSGFILFGMPFVNLWAGSDYHSSYIITVIFMAALLCPLIQNVGISILMARNQLKFRSLCYLAISLISLALQYYASKQWGPVGCAAAIAVGLIGGQWVAMNIYYYIRQRLDIPRFWREIGRMSIAPVFLLVGCGLALRYVTVDNWFTLSAYAVAYAVIFVFVMYRFACNDYEKGLISAPIRYLGNKLSLIKS